MIAQRPLPQTRRTVEEVSALSLRALAKLLDIDIADTIGCGDSANDMAMLEAAGVGVVVSNATPDTAAIADYCAKSSCDDGVFAEVLEKFIEPQHK